MNSDTDSEYDRRAYGQYASLAAEGDSDIDEEAASYLRSVRQVFHSPAQAYFSFQRLQQSRLLLTCLTSGSI